MSECCTELGPMGGYNFAVQIWAEVKCHIVRLLDINSINKKVAKLKDIKSKLKYYSQDTLP